MEVNYLGDPMQAMHADGEVEAVFGEQAAVEGSWHASRKVLPHQLG
jgi:hypothetical protein